MNACHILFLTSLPFLAPDYRGKPTLGDQEKKAAPPHEAAASKSDNPPEQSSR